MSVLIKGMEMPTSCLYCFACHVLSDDGLYCEPLDTDIEPCSFGRLANCPLVPVPPHGRLIDEIWLNMQIQTAKEIHANEKHDFCNAFDSNGHVCTEWWCVEDMIENAPTIIPAEEGKNEADI